MRQQCVYDFMLEYQEANGMPPTMTEIMQACPTLNYRSSAARAIEALYKLGLVVECRATGKSRRYKAVQMGEIDES